MINYYFFLIDNLEFSMYNKFDYFERYTQAYFKIKLLKLYKFFIVFEFGFKAVLQYNYAIVVELVDTLS